MCYAYRDSKKEEKLFEHLITTADICSERWELKALALKTSRLLGIDSKKVEEAIVLASMLHDLGKAAEVYQGECFAGGCTEFKGHYMVSAFIVHLVFSANNVVIGREDVERFLTDDMGSLSEDKLYAMLVVLPVAFHHYHQVLSFRSYCTGKAIEKFLENPRVHASCLEEAKSMLSYERLGQDCRKLLEQIYNVLTNIERLAGKDVYRGSKIFVQNFCYDIVWKDLKRFAENPITLGKMLIEAVYGLINMCDSRAASIKRR